MIELNVTESFTITKKGDSSVHVGLTRAEAEYLWSQLGLALFPDKGNSGWKVGDTIKSYSHEPDLPVGSVIRDDSVYKDEAVKTKDGWQWRTLLEAPSASEFLWPDWQEQSWTVIQVGD